MIRRAFASLPLILAASAVARIEVKSEPDTAEPTSIDAKRQELGRKERVAKQVFDYSQNYIPAQYRSKRPYNAELLAKAQAKRERKAKSKLA